MGPRDKAIIIRVTEEDRARWHVAAEHAKRTLSDWIRVTLDEASAKIRRKMKRR